MKYPGTGDIGKRKELLQDLSEPTASGDGCLPRAAAVDEGTQLKGEMEQIARGLPFLGLLVRGQRTRGLRKDGGQFSEPQSSVQGLLEGQSGKHLCMAEHTNKNDPQV